MSPTWSRVSRTPTPRCARTPRGRSPSYDRTPATSRRRSPSAPGIRPAPPPPSPAGLGFGPASLCFAGAHFDGVHLHTFIGHEGLRRARALIQEGAEAAGRNPDAVKITTVCATAVEPDRESHLRKMVARMATYMQAPNYVELLAELNGWDAEVLEAFRASQPLSSARSST